MTEHSVKVRWLIDEEREQTTAQFAAGRGAAGSGKPLTPREWLERCRELAASEEDAVAIARACYHAEQEGSASLASPVHQACLYYKQECWCRVCDPDGSRWRQRQTMQDLETASLQPVHLPEALAEWVLRCRPYVRSNEDALDVARMCCEEERRGFLGYATPEHQSASFYGKTCRCRLCAPTARMSWREKLRYRLQRSWLGRLVPGTEQWTL